MKVILVSPQTGEYVKIKHNEEGKTFTNIYIRYAPDDWELDRKYNFHGGQVFECDEIEQAYQKFISNLNNNNNQITKKNDK